MHWHLDCPHCGNTADPGGLPTTCDKCGQPWLVRYRPRPWSVRDRAELRRGHGMWRFRSLLPIAPGEDPVSLGEGDTPLLGVPAWGARVGLPHLLVKDEGINPTGSFKSRGLSAAITRAVAAGARTFMIPTAGNAGVAASAYAARAGATVRVYAPRTTPATLLQQVVAHGGELVLMEGHIGDCGKAGKEWAEANGAVNLSTLREPYRIEGKKTLGLELALQLGWRLPRAIIYPAGGGTGLIGMWKAFGELRDMGWVEGDLPLMFAVQATGCAPIVKAVEDGADHADPWPDPWTVASGLRVPAPLGDRLMLRAIRESGGGALAVPDDRLVETAGEAMRTTGVDLCPEGGAALAAAAELRAQGRLEEGDQVVVFNTGAGWLYRGAGDLPPG